jgi:hypothetical protein
MRIYALFPSLSFGLMEVVIWPALTSHGLMDISGL